MGSQAHYNENDLTIATATAEDLLDLGIRYCLGREVTRDLVSAHKWFNLAALKGSEPARQYRCEISQEMSAAEIAYAQREARTWLTLH
jgi:TPR repeat protein